jgi:hypothetical protein
MKFLEKFNLNIIRIKMILFNFHKIKEKKNIFLFFKYFISIFLYIKKIKKILLFLMIS